jgi:hypothetical protein
MPSPAGAATTALIPKFTLGHSPKDLLLERVSTSKQNVNAKSGS